MEGRCVQHACFIYNPDRRKYQGTEGKGMDAGICFLSGAFNLYHDLEICRDIFHTGISDIIDLTTFDDVRNTSMEDIPATSITSLFYQISIKNWAGLLEIVVICSNILSFAKYKKETK